MTRPKKNDATLALGDAVSRSHTTKGEYTPAQGDFVAGQYDHHDIDRAFSAVGLQRPGDVAEVEGAKRKVVTNLNGDVVGYEQGYGARLTVDHGYFDSAGEPHAMKPGGYGKLAMLAAAGGYDHPGDFVHDYYTRRQSRMNEETKFRERARIEARDDLDRERRGAGGDWRLPTESGEHAQRVEVLKSIFDGTYQPPKQQWGRRTDGRALFYPATMNLVFGGTGKGKTWISLLTAVEVLAAGGTVVFDDYESSYAKIVSRLHKLGAAFDAIAERFIYVSGRTFPAPGTDAEDTFTRFADTVAADLWIIDGASSAIGAVGNNNDATDVVAWIDAYPARVRSGTADTCVIINDHTVKSGITDSPQGSGQKIGRADGLAVYAEPLKPIGTESLRLALKWRKERDRADDGGAYLEDDDGELTVAHFVLRPAMHGAQHDLDAELLPPRASDQAYRAAQARDMTTGAYDGELLSIADKAGASRPAVMAAVIALLDTAGEGVTATEITDHLKASAPRAVKKGVFGGRPEKVDVATVTRSLSSHGGRKKKNRFYAAPDQLNTAAKAYFDTLSKALDADVEGADAEAEVDPATALFAPAASNPFRPAWTA